MKIKSFILLSVISLLSVIYAVSVTSCSKERQVVPYDFDTAEILKPLEPNDDSSPENLTFGSENIHGTVLDQEFTTDLNEVYVYFQNLTILDINPGVTQSLFDFCFKQLAEYGFINDSISFPSNEFKTLMSQGNSYTEASEKILESLKSAFEAQKDTIASFQTPFNIYFQIYPIYLDQKLVTYRQTAYAYTGGAHGITISYLMTYSLETGKALTFEDIVKPTDYEAVKEEVAAHMAYSYPIYENITTVPQYIDSLNVWLDNYNAEDTSGQITIENFPVEDVAIVEQGLVFVYQMYELTPGSDGCPMVLIPYKDIRGCLLPDIDK